MNTDYSLQIASTLQLKQASVQAVLQLLQEGSTIPFIARYRKDKTGNLNEVDIANINDEAKRLEEFYARKLAIEKSITEQGKMTDSLQQQLNQANTLSDLEDVYLPYKPKRKTKAQVAKEQGLEPLAWLIFEQQADVDPNILAQQYLTDAVTSITDALQGAKDILAEFMNEDIACRQYVRTLFEKEALLVSEVQEEKKEVGAKYKDYFDYKELISTIPSHRILAIFRGFLEGVLKMSIAPSEEVAIAWLEDKFLKNNGETACGLIVKKAVKDAYKRFLQPAMETECRNLLKERADEEAIQVFASNVRQLLLSSPLGSKRILAIDPGYRTGCKVVCLNEQGGLLHNDVIYIHEANKIQHSQEVVSALIKQYQIQVIAVGDGTAGRETEQFLKKMQVNLPIILVNEDGASIYSASEIARQEFPNHDVTVRGAVSIGRRLMDPLAELVKIDPKSIGVGQYQHDVNQVKLKEKLDQTVQSCVNLVGVNINTASKQLLSYVSGIGNTLAENIIQYRQAKGNFTNRQQLLEVPRLGPKVFEQCAGFLRIAQAENPLDNSAVHPEAYPIVEKMASDLQTPIQQLIGNDVLLGKINKHAYTNADIGDLAINDIINELKKPGLDPRSELEMFEFAAIFSIEDVKPGMIVPGVVTNITKFGAFVDIGVKQDGLVHVSEVAHRYIQDAAEVLKLQQKVNVLVLAVDYERKRISLSIKQASTQANQKQAHLKQASSFKPKQAQKQDEHNFSDALSALQKKFSKA